MKTILKFGHEDQEEARRCMKATDAYLALHNIQDKVFGLLKIINDEELVLDYKEVIRSFVNEFDCELAYRGIDLENDLS
jgi:hypothetical protein